MPFLFAISLESEEWNSLKRFDWITNMIAITWVRPTEDLAS